MNPQIIQIKLDIQETNVQTYHKDAKERTNQRHHKTCKEETATHLYWNKILLANLNAEMYNQEIKHDRICKSHLFSLHGWNAWFTLTIHALDPWRHQQSYRKMTGKFSHPALVIQGNHSINSLLVLCIWKVTSDLRIEVNKL